MSSGYAVGLQPRGNRPPQAKIIPLFVCPGAKDAPVGHIVFPHGDGFTELVPCPAREACVWYAGHDLGGSTAINEFPPEVVLPGEFESPNFSCPHFLVDDALCRDARHQKDEAAR